MIAVNITTAKKSSVATFVKVSIISELLLVGKIKVILLVKVNINKNINNNNNNNNIFKPMVPIIY